MIKILTIIAVGAGVFGLVHQYILTGRWFDWAQFWHHEPLIACCFVASVALVVGNRLKRAKK